jgi:inosine-uridine nucleoside N-ribohydrolase
MSAFKNPSSSRRKVIADQDARGPCTSDTLALLMLAQSDAVDLLGITTVSGDQWVKEETAHALRALEIAGRTDVPVIAGAERPLINNRIDSEIWETRYGRIPYKGAWTPRLYHEPDIIPTLPEGAPTTKALDEHAVDFIIRTVRAHPHEVTLWAGGPLTNIAMAVRKAPDIVPLVDELVMMGGGIYADRSGLPDANGRREFNWWFDAEAAWIVLSEAWKKIVLTPLDISVKTRFEQALVDRIAAAGTPVAEYVGRFGSPPSLHMWDELSIAAMLRPELITEQREIYLSVDIDHGAGYGQTLFSLIDRPPNWAKATVNIEADYAAFYEFFVELMTAPIGSGLGQH